MAELPFSGRDSPQTDIVPGRLTVRMKMIVQMVECVYVRLMHMYLRKIYVWNTKRKQRDKIKYGEYRNWSLLVTIGAEIERVWSAAEKILIPCPLQHSNSSARGHGLRKDNSKWKVWRSGHD
jgi:hypothetical protein